MFEYINLLTKAELRRFEVFINSRYFNTYKTIILLFEYLKTQYPNVNKNDVTVSKISMIVYMEEKINTLKIRKLCSDFKKLFEKFLHHEFIEKRTLITNDEYLEYLNVREMQELYVNNLKEANSLLEKTKEKNEVYYLKKCNLNIISSTSNINNRHIYDYKMFNEGLANIDYYFITRKMWGFINIIFLRHENKMAPVQDNNFEKEIIEFIESKENDLSKHHPYIYFLYLSYKMFSTFDDKYYNLLVKYFNKNIEKLNGKVIQSYYAYQNYYLRKKLNNLSMNYAAYHKKLYNLYVQTFNSKDKYKYFLIKGLIQSSLYISVVSIYLRENDKENAIAFIHNYKKYLPKDLREDSYNYSMGLYHYNNNELQTALLNYNKISDKSTPLKYNRKAALMRIYFELEDMLSLNNEMTNMYQFGYRNKQAEKLYKHRIKTYLKYFRSLIRLKSLKLSGKKNLSYEKNVLRKQIENESNLLHPKIWFMKTLNSI